MRDAAPAYAAMPRAAPPADACLRRRHAYYTIACLLMRKILPRRHLPSRRLLRADAA